VYNIPLNIPLNKRTRVLAGALGFIAILLFLELASLVILDKAVHPTRLRRFDDIYSTSVDEYQLKSHPFLRYVQPHYLVEEEDFLNHVANDSAQNESHTIHIVALGGSTTRRGYPKYTQAYLDKKLEELGSPFEVVVFNFGVDGWSSFQSVQNYFYLLKYLHPDFTVIHHNHNEPWVENLFNANSIVYYPQISTFERNLVGKSNLYKLIKFTYLLSYNSLFYDEDIRFYTIIDSKEDFPMPARISAYVNDEDPDAFMPLFFQRDFVGFDYPTDVITRDFLLTENYESLIRYAHADNAEVVLTTQYQNFSKAAPGKYESLSSKAQTSAEINDVIRKISEEGGVPLVDLDHDMEPYGGLMYDEAHFLESGIKVKGELIAEKIWELLNVRYNLTELRVG